MTTITTNATTAMYLVGVFLWISESIALWRGAWSCDRVHKRGSNTTL